MRGLLNYRSEKSRKLLSLESHYQNSLINVDRTLLDVRKRPKQIPRGLFECKLCGIAIYNHIACWKEHLEAIPDG